MKKSLLLVDVPVFTRRVLSRPVVRSSIVRRSGRGSEHVLKQPAELSQVIARRRMDDDRLLRAGAFDLSHAKAVSPQPPSRLRRAEPDVQPIAFDGHNAHCPAPPYGPQTACDGVSSIRPCEIQPWRPMVRYP